MRFNFSVYAIFLVIAGAWAWWASLPRQDGNAEVDRWISIVPASVEEVTMSTKEEQVAIKLDGSSGQYWVDYSREVPAVTPPPASTPAANTEVKPTPTPAPTRENERFLASDKLKEMMDEFNPLEALRVIGKVSGDALEEFGLKTPEGSVRIVEKGGNAHEFRVGKKAFGTQNVYLLDVARGEVILVDGMAVDTIRRARARLYERRLTAAVYDELSGADVSVPGVDNAAARVRKMRVAKKDEQGELVWTDDGGKGEAKPSYKTWLSKLERLRLTSFAKAEDEALVKAARVVFEVTLYAKGAEVDRLTFLKSAAQPGAADPESAKDTYWVRSGLIKVPARLSADRVDPVEKDLATIL